jgi:DNA-binding MarR family transcriptional regulator
MVQTSQPPPAGPRDSVDRLLAGWARARPDLDLSPVAVIARLDRLRRIIDSELEATFAEHGLNGPDFAALVTLRRLDEPGGVSQRRLMRELNLTSGTVSVRVERLAERGLVTSSEDPRDRRNTLVVLTPAGHELFDRVTPAHIATENRLLAALSAGQVAELVTLLRQLLVSFEGSADGDDELPRLGLSLAPAHQAIEIRRAVGLPEFIGLLVRSVEPGSRAGQAGIKTGDVLIRAGHEPLRSVTALYQVINAARAAGSLTITAVRGVDTEVDAVVDLGPRPAGQTPPARPAPGPGAATHSV